MNRAPEFTPRSELAWAAACAAALPSEALQILFEARAKGGRQVDATDAWLAYVEQKSEAQARSKARRSEIKGWGTGARWGEDEADESDQIGRLSMPHGMGEWALRQDPADARAVLEIRAALEACDISAVIEAAGLSCLEQDPAAVARLQLELRRWAALDDLYEVDTQDIARRDGVTLRMAQVALRAQREALKNGQGVLL